MKTIGIIGTRRRDTVNDFVLVEFAFFKIYEPGDRICSGLCPKGGDRFADNIPEKKVCDNLGIKIIDGLGEKIYNSSEMVKNEK